jgi:hypothetical protein
MNASGRKRKRTTSASLNSCRAAVLAHTQTPLRASQQKQLADLFEAAYLEVPLADSAAAHNNVRAFAKALNDIRELLQAAQVQGALNTVQSDVERLLVAELPGSGHWNLLSAAAWARNAGFLAAVLEQQPSAECLSWPDSAGTDLPTAHVGHNGLTALFGVAYRNDAERARLLLQAGASIRSTATDATIEGQTAAHYALGQKDCSGELISVLIEYGVNVLQRDANGFSLLHWCIPQRGCKYKVEAARVILQEMKAVDANADFRVADAYSSSALAWCMLNNAELADEAILPMVQLLLKHGAKPHCSELILEGDTPLKRAVDTGLLQCAGAMQQTARAAAVTQQRGASAAAAANSSSSSRGTRSSSSRSAVSSETSRSSNSTSSCGSSSSSSNSSGSCTGIAVSAAAQAASSSAATVSNTVRVASSHSSSTTTAIVTDLHSSCSSNSANSASLGSGVLGNTQEGSDTTATTNTTQQQQQQQ